ncbi:putative monooxygenase [Mycena sanguinolenta]|uniref:Putative monooxygenase n=1 Tax=Mycena sanguinolenta TaxID=230812 RepID=A0A8H6ZD98_9AGAR|nr:putative monooxygenase [Mycena sanguinolenta]
MSGSVPTKILVTVGVFAGYLVWKSTARKNTTFRLTCQWKTFSKWAETYGSIVYVDALGQPIIIINSAKVANDLLDKRGSIYSDRPIWPYNESWRQQRKIVAQAFSPAAVRQYHPLQETEARKLVHGLLDDPSTLRRQTQLRIGAIILRVAYGRYVTGENDPFLTTGLMALDFFTTAGIWAVDVLPMLRYIPSWLPGSGFLRIAIYMDAAWNPYLWCKKNLATGAVLLPNFCAQYLAAEDVEISEEQEEKLAWAALFVLSGGLDSNISFIFTFFLAVILNPSVQCKAQEEIDRVIGPDRLPVIQDRASLPYVRALMAEVFRWHPAVPLGIAHALTQDDIYDGMHLSKGSVVITNAW